MKIVFFTRLFYPHIGGVEKHVLLLSKELQKKGHEVIVVTERHNRKIKKYEQYKGIKIHRITITRQEKIKKYIIWKWIIKNKKLFLDSDILHAHDVFFWLLPIRFLMPRKKVFTTFHGYEGNSIPRFKEKIMHKMAEKFSHRTMCIGGFYKKWYGTNSEIVTYGAVNSVATNRDLINNKKIVYIGRLENEAGIDTYIDSIRLLANYGINLEVFGDGARRSSLERLIKKENLPVKIHGWTLTPEIKISKSKIVFTSRYLGILEALAQDKFVIAEYNNDIKKDYLQMTPFSKYISILKSSEEIALQVMKFYKNPKKFDAKIKKGGEWARLQTWEMMSQDYLKLWNL